MTLAVLAISTSPWSVVVVKHMIPSHSGITEFEAELQEIAATLGGYNDGRGCIPWMRLFDVSGSDS